VSSLFARTIDPTFAPCRTHSLRVARFSGAGFRAALRCSGSQVLANDALLGFGVDQVKRVVKFSGHGITRAGSTILGGKGLIEDSAHRRLDLSVSKMRVATSYPLGCRLPLFEHFPDHFRCGAHVIAPINRLWEGLGEMSKRRVAALDLFTNSLSMLISRTIAVAVGQGRYNGRRIAIALFDSLVNLCNRLLIVLSIQSYASRRAIKFGERCGVHDLTPSFVLGSEHVRDYNPSRLSCTV
jgi:hypothetical protein